MKRVAILCNYKLIPERIGGMDYFFKAYNEALLDLNYKVDWFFSTGEQHEFYKTMPLNIANSDNVEAFFYDKTRETDVTYDFIITHFVELCTKWFKRFKSRFPDSKIIAVDHNPRPFNGYSFSKQIKKKIKGVLYARYTDLFVGVSNYTCRHILNDFGYLLRNKIITVYNGVVTNNIDLRESIQDNNYIHFVVISHLRKSKGIQDLIEALNFLSENEIRHLKIDIYGEGPYENYLKALVKKYNLETCIDFKGSCSSLKSLIKNYHFMIQPTYMECFSLSILESLAANVPVITTPVGGNLEVISNGVNGFIHKVSDVKALSLIIKKIISKELIINNSTRPLIENKFSIDTMVKNHIKYLD